MDTAKLRWRKSLHSMGNGGNCVEVARLGRRLYVQDSKNPSREILELDRDQWTALVRLIKNDAFAGD